MGFFDKLSKANLPTTEDISKIPAQTKEKNENLKLNQITVRFFNQDFSKVIESIGYISHETAIPIVYFDKPSKLAVIMFDDVSYMDVTRNNMQCIDVCESYAYGIDKNSSLAKDLKVKYYNDIREKKLGDKSKELYYKTGCGYYVPVLLNNIPIPIIQIEKNYDLRLLNLGFVKHAQEITMSTLRQLADGKLLSRVGKKDNTALMFCAVLFMFLGVIFGMGIMAWILS